MMLFAVHMRLTLKAVSESVLLQRKGFEMRIRIPEGSIFPRT